MEFPYRAPNAKAHEGIEWVFSKAAAGRSTRVGGKLPSLTPASTRRHSSAICMTRSTGETPPAAAARWSNLKGQGICKKTKKAGWEHKKRGSNLAECQQTRENGVRLLHGARVKHNNAGDRTRQQETGI